GHPLVQPLQLDLAGGTFLQMHPRRGIARLEAGLAQTQQGVHRQMTHLSPSSSPSQRRSRTWARANWDLEKLGVFPITPAISSWYRPMLRHTSKKVSCSTSSASSAVRQIRRARLYTGASYARYSSSCAAGSPAFTLGSTASASASR